MSCPPVPVIPFADTAGSLPKVRAKRRWFFSKSQIICLESNGFSFYSKKYMIGGAPNKFIFDRASRYKCIGI